MPAPSLGTSPFTSVDRDLGTKGKNILSNFSEFTRWNMLMVQSFPYRQSGGPYIYGIIIGLSQPKLIEPVHG
jgi:hypothetical protein